jgi:hypothetical protein
MIMRLSKELFRQHMTLLKYERKDESGSQQTSLGVQCKDTCKIGRTEKLLLLSLRWATLQFELLHLVKHIDHRVLLACEQDRMITVPGRFALSRSSARPGLG